jgi:hypothetical protein
MLPPSSATGWADAARTYNWPGSPAVAGIVVASPFASRTQAASAEPRAWDLFQLRVSFTSNYNLCSAVVEGFMDTRKLRFPSCNMSWQDLSMDVAS